MNSTMNGNSTTTTPPPEGESSFSTLHPRQEQEQQQQQEHNFGIKGWTLYVPPSYVSQEKLEEYDGVPPGKYTKGLGQISMSAAEACEDIVSMMLTATQNLIQETGIDPNDVGRLEVGTETLVDK